MYVISQTTERSEGGGRHWNQFNKTRAMLIVHIKIKFGFEDSQNLNHEI